MQPQSTPGWTPLQDLRTTASLLAILIAALAATVEPMLRTRFGRSYFGVPAAIGFFAVPMWMLLWPGEDPRPILWFWGLFFVAQLRARIEQFVLAARGYQQHSRYNGRPLLRVVFRRMSECRIKGAVEPVVVIGAGACLLEVSEPLGSFLITSGTCLALTVSMIESRERARAQAIRDAWIEQEQLVERVRETAKGSGPPVKGLGRRRVHPKRSKR